MIEECHFAHLSLGYQKSPPSLPGGLSRSKSVDLSGIAEAGLSASSRLGELLAT
jgi:hypothetical protein